MQSKVSMHVETVVLLSKGMVDNRKVKVDFSLEDMDLSEFKGKATYEQIKVYVLEQTGLKVSNLYIAQIKKKCGLDVGKNFNLPKFENAKQPKCTQEKEEAIMQAFLIFLKNIVYNETNMTYRCRVVDVRIYQEVKAI